MLLNKEDDFGNAIDRAQAAFEVVVHLGQGEKTDVTDSATNNNNEGLITSFISKFVNPVSAEEEEIANFKVLLERQNTFRPVFGALMKATLAERRHASHLRRLLAENNIDYDKLKTAYESSAKDGIEGILKNEVPNAKEKDLTELLEILDCFFDPEKNAIQPKPRFFANQNRHPRSRTQSNNNKENGEVNGNNNSTEGSGNTSSSETTPRTAENGIVEQSQPSETIVQ